ncbi:MAG: MFS transporter [Candidatus Dormibacteraeota bacterium]|uniref:MFS transporter n=1 Tax=Candidatus Amunia macphersoniae TaxID=3127014 RepID=A0A934KQY1_9BACT|nr:MFS transporter [Candidatus Dormibacteraeota bacterium]
MEQDEVETATAPVLTAAVPAMVQLPVAVPPLRRWPPPALAVPAFRWYWIAQWPTLLGTWMQVVALGYLVYSLTHSSAAVAAVAAADGLPAVILSLGGGLLADRLPRRRILLVTQSVLGVSSGVLAVLALTGHAGFWAIIAVAVVYGSADAVDLPTRQAMVADLVDRENIVNAVALSSTAMSATRIIGPSLAGLLIASAGPGACFAVLSAAYIAPLAVLLTVIPDVRPLPRAAGATAVGELFEGVRSVRRDPMVRGIVIVCAALALLGVSYMPYLPILARDQLHGGSTVLGLLYSIGGFGGVVGGIVIATIGNTGGRRRLLVVGGIIYGVSLFGLAHSTALPLSLVALMGISFAFLAMNTSMTTLLQTDADPALRGRLLGIYAMLFAGLQPLGTVLYAILDHVIGLFTAIGLGAITVGVVAVTVGMSPSFRSRFNVDPSRPRPVSRSAD